MPLQVPLLPKYERLTPIGDSYLKRSSSGRNLSYINVVCDCGISKHVRLDHLRNGKSKSCGCYSKDNLSNLRHGYKSHPLYSIYYGIKKRCYNPANPGYKYYGGRGIKMCDEWLNNRTGFIEWCLQNGWTQGLEIDRYPDMNGDYSPQNCRITTNAKNCQNRRVCKLNDGRVLIIRKLVKEGIFSRKHLANLYGITYGHICWLVQGKSWIAAV